MAMLRLADFLPYRLSVASNTVSSVIATAYESLFGLKIAEWRLVAVIAEGEYLTQQTIGAATRMDKVTVSRAAIALVERGLVERKANPDDLRSHHLALTIAGQALYDSVAPKALELEARIFSGLEPDEISAFVAILDRISAAASGLEG